MFTNDNGTYIYAMQKRWIATLVLFTGLMTSLVAQPNAFHYELDAWMAKRVSEEGVSYQFYSIQRPVWDSKGPQISDLQSAVEGILAPVSYNAKELMTELKAVPLTDLMTERQIREMLIAKAGMAASPPKRTEFVSTMHLIKVEVSVEGEAWLNVERMHEQLNHGVEQHSREYACYSYDNASRLTLGHLGSKQILKCVLAEEKKMETWKEVIASEWIKDYQKGLGCENRVARITETTISVLPMQLQSVLPKRAQREQYELLIERSCFENDQLCQSK